MPTEEVGQEDAEALARQEAQQLKRSAELAAAYTTRIGSAETMVALQQVGGELTAAVKKVLAAPDLARVRVAYSQRLAQLKASAGNGPPPPSAAGRNGA